MMIDPRATDTDTTNEAAPEGFGNLPIQPTGSGVADLEIAYEQMRLSEDADADVAALNEDLDPATVPTESGDAATESAAHPS
jgi:hypothetical protein